MNPTESCQNTSCAPAPSRAVARPAYDVREDDGQAVLQVALPGVRKEDLTITVEGQALVVTADRSDAAPETSPEGRQPSEE